MKRWMTLILALSMILTGMWTASAQEGGIGSADKLYFAQTPLYASSSGKLNNIRLSAEAVDGTVIYFGETFSFNETVGPRSEEYGFKPARNGRGVQVWGGGVSQAAATLYLALKEAPFVEIAPFMSYDEKFAEWYVEDGRDAVVTDYNAGHDFSFTSEYEGAICINMWMDESYVYCLLTFDEDEQPYSQSARSSTPIFGSENKQHNIAMAADCVNGVMLDCGDAFSFNELVGPRTAEAGFRAAENGRGVKVYGGGVAQIASTVYLAVKELECVELDAVRTYGEQFVDGYVADSADAIVTDYNAGIDFSFTYWGDGTMLILVYRDGSRLVCEVYEF